MRRRSWEEVHEGGREGREGGREGGSEEWLEWEVGGGRGFGRKGLQGEKRFGREKVSEEVQEEEEV